MSRVQLDDDGAREGVDEVVDLRGVHWGLEHPTPSVAPVECLERVAVADIRAAEVLARQPVGVPVEPDRRREAPVVEIGAHGEYALLGQAGAGIVDRAEFGLRTCSISWTPAARSMNSSRSASVIDPTGTGPDPTAPRAAGHSVARGRTERSRTRLARVGSGAPVE